MVFISLNVDINLFLSSSYFKPQNEKYNNLSLIKSQFSNVNNLFSTNISIDFIGCLLSIKKPNLLYVFSKFIS